MEKSTLVKLFQQGNAAQSAGRLEEADRLYTTILKVNPKHPETNHNMGLLAVTVGKAEQGLTFFNRAVEASPNVDQFWFSYIDTLIKVGRREEAKSLFGKAKKKITKGNRLDQLESALFAPVIDAERDSYHHGKIKKHQTNILDTLKLDQALRLAKNRSEKGANDEAEVIYKDILKKFPKNRRASSGLKGLTARAFDQESKVQNPSQDQLQPLIDLHSRGQLKEALAQATELSQLFPNSFVLYNIFGIIRHGLGQLDASIESYNKALAIKPDFALAICNRGNALKDQGKFEEALEAYRKTVAIEPFNAAALSNMGVVFENQGKLDDAVEAYNKALFIKPDFFQGYCNLGNTLKALCRLVEAEDCYRKAIELQPGVSETHKNLADVLQQLERFAESEASYNQAIALNPSRSHYYSGLGNVLAKLGKLDDAEASYKKAISLRSGPAETHFNLGRTLQEAGRLDEAVSSFQTAFIKRTGIRPAGDDILAPAITSMHFELTNKCNFHCTFCPSDSQTRDIGSMDINLIKRLYEEAADKKIGNVVGLHLMGEPTLHPRLIEILKFGALKNIKTDLVTNGSTLVAKIVPKILDSLYGTITASHMTPTQETYHFRGKVRLSWDRYIANMRLLVREYMQRVAKGDDIKCDLVIRVMATQDTASNVTVTETASKASAILKEWNDYVSEIEKELGMKPFERKDHNDDNLLQENRHASITYPLQKGIKLLFWRAFTFANTRVSEDFELQRQNTASFCPNPFTDVGVLWNGDVTLCGLDHDGELKVGSIHDSSIEEVIQNRAARELRSSMLGHRPLPPLCQNCQAKPVRRGSI